MIMKTFIRHLYRYFPNAKYCEYNDLQIKKLKTHDFEYIGYDPDDDSLRDYKCRVCGIEYSIYMKRVKRFSSKSTNWPRTALLPRQVSCDEYKMNEAIG